MTYATATVTDSVESIQELRTVEISFFDHEIYCGDKLIASISYDDGDFVTQPWVVMVNGEEIHRANTYAKCHTYIRTHYKRGTLPVQQPETPAATTGNEIMAQIAVGCEQLGLELRDDGIYRNDKRLVEFVYKNGVCWYVRASLEPLQIASELLFEDCSGEELLDIPFELLTPEQWEKVRDFEAVEELVTV